MKKELPFKKTSMSYEPCTNHIWGIIASDYERFQGALHNNFIEIVTTSAANFCGVRNWLNYHMFDVNKVPREMILEKDKEQIKETIKTWIDREQYVLIYFNTFYISQYPSYQKYDFNHHAMIYGYDTQEEVFLCADFFDFTYYTVQRCSMNEVVDAIIHNENPLRKVYESDFVLLRISETTVPKVFTNQIIASLYALIAPNNPNYKRAYGLNLIDNICLAIENGDLEDIRHEFKRKAHFLVAHMEVMLLRMEYFAQKSGSEEFQELLRSMSELKKQAEQYRNYVLKLIIRDQWIFPEEKREQYINRLREIKEKYTFCIQTFINLLLEMN